MTDNIEEPLEAGGPAMERSPYLQMPRMTADELDMQNLDMDAYATVDALEDAWTDFLLDNPNALEDSPLNQLLELELEEIQQTQEYFLEEMQAQLTTFLTKKRELEDTYKQLMTTETKKQQNLYHTLQGQIDQQAKVHEYIQKVIPWNHWFAQLDDIVDEEGPGDYYDKVKALVPGGNQGGFGPSERGVYLTNASIESVQTIYERAYRVDDALLRAQCAMLLKEIQAHEDGLEAMTIVGEFLKDQKAWNLVK